MTAVVDAKGGGHSMKQRHSMVATMADCEEAARPRGQRLRRRHNNEIKEEAAFGHPPDTFGRMKRKWQGICGMLTMAPWFGYGAAALSGQRQCICGAQAAAHIIIRGALAAPTNAWAVGGGVGGSTLAELWWGHCWGGGLWQCICGAAVAC